MKAAAGRLKLPGRGRQAGWQTARRQAGAGSRHAVRQADKQPSRQRGKQGGRQADEIRKRGKFW
jgi:hypothetical protein